MSDEWGVGNKAQDKAFATAMVGKTEVELIFGEHPHSRQDNNIYARWPSGRIEGFDGHRVAWKIEIETSNYLKESELSGEEVRKGGSLRIWKDGVQVADEFFREVPAALRKAERLLTEISEHWPHGEPSEWVGRKVYYREIPAVIEYVILDQGCVVVKAEQGVFPPHPYEREDGRSEAEATAKVEIASPHIWWWRK